MACHEKHFFSFINNITDTLIAAPDVYIKGGKCTEKKSCGRQCPEHSRRSVRFLSIPSWVLELEHIVIFVRTFVCMFTTYAAPRGVAERKLVPVGR